MNLGEDERQLQAERLMIEEIKQRPFLWDETLPEHKDLEKARTAWENVGRIFGMSGTKAKSRWKSMRDIYVRYLRKLALKGGSAPKWKHFDAMSFIADHIKHRRGDLQYANFGGAGIPAGNPSNGNKAGEIKYDVLRNSDEDEDAPGGSGSKRVTRGRKRKRMAAAAAAADVASLAPRTSTPRLPVSAARPSLSGASVSSTTSGGVPVMPMLSPPMMPAISSPIITTAAAIIGRHQLQQQTAGQPQHQMTMIGTGLIPVSSIGIATTSSGSSGSRGLNGQETTSFAAIPIDDDADDLFGRAVAATLKKMPSRMKALSKLRIQQVLYELEEATNTPPPNAIVYQSTIAGQQQQQAPPSAPQGFM